MPQNFSRGDDPGQGYLLPPDAREWLPPRHLAWELLALAKEMDLASFTSWYRADGQGRPAYHPAMMVTLVGYCFCKGIRSSRAIEMATFDDVGARVICANLHPDHSTIHRFVTRHEQPVKGLVVQSVVACAREGLVSVDVVAGDGTKVRASASMAANVTLGELDLQIGELERLVAAEVDAWIAQARAEDAAQDALTGDGGGAGRPGGPPRGGPRGPGPPAGPPARPPPAPARPAPPGGPPPGGGQRGRAAETTAPPAPPGRGPARRAGRGSPAPAPGHGRRRPGRRRPPRPDRHGAVCRRVRQRRQLPRRRQAELYAAVTREARQTGRLDDGKKPKTRKDSWQQMATHLSYRDEKADLELHLRAASHNLLKAIRAPRRRARQQRTPQPAVPPLAT